MKPKKTVLGVGINDADYPVQRKETIGYVGGKQRFKLVWACPFYQVWAAMLKRCYSANFQKKRPTYAGCTATDEWHSFSKFRAWMEKQDWQGKSLDKDLLFEGNKVYSPETCVFVTTMVNGFTTDSGAARGEWMIGAHWNKNAGKFLAQCSNPFTKKNEYLGLFTNEQQAHNAWLKRKTELAHELAEIQEDPRVAKALVDRYSKIQISEN